ADSLHGVHGAAAGQHVPGDSADRQEVQRGDDQLGFRQWEIADQSTVGFVAKAVHGSRTRRVVPRYLSEGWHTVPAGRGGIYPPDDGVWSEDKESKSGEVGKGC